MISASFMPSACLMSFHILIPDAPDIWLDLVPPSISQMVGQMTSTLLRFKHLLNPNSCHFHLICKILARTYAQLSLLCRVAAGCHQISFFALSKVPHWQIHHIGSMLSYQLQLERFLQQTLLRTYLQDTQPIHLRKLR